MTSPIHNQQTPQQGQKKIQKYIFSLKKLLGKGSYANVYLGRSIYDENLQVAVKVIDKKIFANKYNLKNIQSEIDIMKKVNHPNIVQLYDVYQTTNNMYIVTQYCEDGDLNTYLKNKKKLPENDALCFLKNIVMAFKYLLEMGVIHRDLKPANILLSNGSCKISDFGFARSLEYGSDTVLNSIVGTPLYMAPQILKHQNYSNKSDLWSVGLIYYELLHGYTPWIASNELQLINNIYNRPLKVDSSVSDKSKDFISSALRIRQEQRMSWEQAFTHHLFYENQPGKLLPILNRLRMDENQDDNAYHRSKSLKRTKTVNRSPLSHISSNTSNINRTPNRFQRTLGLNPTPQRKSPIRHF